MIVSKTTRLGAASALLGFLVACSSASGSGGAGGNSGIGASCQAYQVPAGTSLTTPTVSLRTDVMNVFNSNCGAATCHGNGDSAMSTGELFLGAESAAGSDAATVRAGIVGKMGDELASMPLVTAGNPTMSYLMHKMDGDQCQYDAQCAGGTCLADMPNGGLSLPVTTRDIVRRWIAQGALDN